MAKGTDTQRSDVDLLVVGTPSLLDVSESIHLLEQQLGRLIHLNLYDPEEWLELVARDPVMGQISQGPKLQVIPDAKTH